MTTAQNNTKGILFILVGMVVFSIQDALIKFIIGTESLDAKIIEIIIDKNKNRVTTRR